MLTDLTMNNKAKNNLNNFSSENNLNSKEVKDNSFLKKEDIKVILQRLKDNPSKINHNLLLDYIRATAPTTTYRIFKETGFAYTSLKAIIREFEFVGLISFHVKINDNNQSYKEIHMEKEK